MGTVLNVYAIYNPEICYCQDMSDFLAPLLIETGDSDGDKWVCDEALVFWCFERMMRRMEANFRIDQSGMHAQLNLLRLVITSADDDLAEFFRETDEQFGFDHLGRQPFVEGGQDELRHVFGALHAAAGGSVG